MFAADEEVRLQKRIFRFAGRERRGGLHGRYVNEGLSGWSDDQIVLIELAVDVGCEKDEECRIMPGRCIGGACFCASYRFYDKGMRYCHKCK